MVPGPDAELIRADGLMRIRCNLLGFLSVKGDTLGLFIVWTTPSLGQCGFEHRVSLVYHNFLRQHMQDVQFRRKGHPNDAQGSDLRWIY